VPRAYFAQSSRKESRALCFWHRNYHFEIWGPLQKSNKQWNVPQAVSWTTWCQLLSFADSHSDPMDHTECCTREHDLSLGATQRAYFLDILPPATQFDWNFYKSDETPVAVYFLKSIFHLLKRLLYSYKTQVHCFHNWWI